MTEKRRYKYIHIWTSEDEVRVKCTDPATLEAVVSAIAKSAERDPNFARLEVKHHWDITGYLNVLSIKGFSEAEMYPRLAWWLFRALCDKGWQPMVTAEHTYKLIYEGRREG